MKKKKAELPAIETETSSPLGIEGPQGEKQLSLREELARCREAMDNPDLADDLGTPVLQFKIGKPAKNAFFRAMPPPEGGYTQVYMIEGKKLVGVADNYYVINGSILRALGEYGKNISPSLLVPTIDRANNVRVWPCPISTKGQGEAWMYSRMKLIKTAVDQWVSYHANMLESRYDWVLAKDQSLKAEWPLDHTYDDILEKAIGEHFVNSFSHEIVKSLVGEATK